MCQYDRTIYTICAHSTDKRVESCHPVTLRNGLGLINRNYRHEGPCNWNRPGSAHLKIGWCPSCAGHLRSGYKHGHPRKIKLNDKHVISNFWAWQAQRNQAGLVKLVAEDIPLDYVDQADEIPYEMEDGYITPIYLMLAHRELSENAPFSYWGELRRNSLFSKTHDSLLTQHERFPPSVPPLGPWCVPEGTQVSYFEDFALWFSLYEFQPAVVYPDPAFRMSHGRDGAKDLDLAALVVDKALTQTRRQYAKDLMRDTEMIRAQDAAERKARERDAEEQEAREQEAREQEAREQEAREQEAEG